jgi:hypothetical protein
VGEALDFWRVEEVEQGRLLRCGRDAVARTGLAGTADGAARPGQPYEQRALFVPKGLAGHLYWKAIAPAHGIVFGGMAENIARAAERLSTRRTPTRLTPTARPRGSAIPVQAAKAPPHPAR